jgi:hypothetical protein
MVSILTGPEEAIIRDIKLIEQVTKMARHLVGKRARSDAQVARFLCHLEAVLIGPGLKPYLTPVQPLEPRQYIGRYRLIRVADVRLAVRIVYRGGEVIGLSHAPGL